VLRENGDIGEADRFQKLDFMNGSQLVSINKLLFLSLLLAWSLFSSW